MLRSCICEYMRSLALSNCVDSRTSQLTFPRWPACFARCVKTGKHVIMKTAHKRHKYVRFVCMFSLVSIAVWIISTYCKTLELIYFVFETFYLLSFFCFWVLQRSRALWFFFFSLCQYNLVIARCMYYIFKINITLNMFFNNNKNNRLFEVSGWTPRRKMLIHFVQQSWRISRNIRTTLEIMKYSLCRFILGSEQCYWFTCVLFWLF